MREQTMGLASGGGGHPSPNHRLPATANSLRSYIAAALGGA
jgi:hypothetical protein